MRVMAVGTVVIDRLMVMHEGAAFLHVAGIAGFVYAIALHEFRTDRAMYIVAIRAGHFAFWNRMVRRLVVLGALLFVASVADVGLGAFFAYGIFCRVYPVARGACHVVGLMGASLPV